MFLLYSGKDRNRVKSASDVATGGRCLGIEQETINIIARMKGVKIGGTLQELTEMFYNVGDYQV